MLKFDNKAFLEEVKGDNYSVFRISLEVFLIVIGIDFKVYTKMKEVRK
jgi:hypothetical protein